MSASNQPRVRVQGGKAREVSPNVSEGSPGMKYIRQLMADAR